MKKVLRILNVAIILPCFFLNVPLNKDEIWSLMLFSLLTVLLFLPSLRKKRKTSMDRIFHKFKKDKRAICGLIVLMLILYLSILAPFVAPYPPNEIDWSALLQGPSQEHWMGTDELGRDVFSRILYGSRVALGLGFTAVILNCIVGTILGMNAGFYGGKVDMIIMRMLEIWNSIPFILLAIAIMAILGTGLIKLIIVVSLTEILSFARIIRGSVLSLKEQDYVAAGRVLGLPNSILLFRHILPNCLAPIIVLASLRIGETIITVAGLSFLGLGIQPPMASLGYMLSSSQQYLSQNISLSIFPGLTILLIVFSMNLLGDGIRDALDSKLLD